MEAHLRLQLKPAVNLLAISPAMQVGNGGTVRTDGSTTKTATQTRGQSACHVTCKSETVGQAERVEAQLKLQLKPAANLCLTETVGQSERVEAHLKATQTDQSKQDIADN